MTGNPVVLHLSAATQARKNSLDKSIEEFRAAFFNLLSAFENNGWIDWGADMEDGYPFGESFEDQCMLVKTWCESLRKLSDENLTEKVFMKHLQAIYKKAGNVQECSIEINAAISNLGLLEKN